MQGFETFMSSLRKKTFRPKKEGSGVDLVLSCVDNYEARMVVNQVRLTAAVVGFNITILSFGISIYKFHMDILFLLWLYRLAMS